MKTLPPTLLAAALALLATPPAHAGATGYCEHEGRRDALVDGVAWVLPPDEDDDDEDTGWDDEEDDAPPPGPEIMLVFATFTFDAGAVARATDRDDAVRDQSWDQDGDTTRLELTQRDGAVTQQNVWMSPGTNLSYSSSEVGHYQPGKAAAGRVAGTYRFTPDDGQELDCEVRFDLALLGDPKDAPPPPPPPGKPLPAGGGDPGRAYLALNKAMLAGDLDALAKLLPPERAAMMQEARQSPDFAAQLALMQAMTVRDVRVTGGRIDGDRAWLDIAGTEGGQPRVGTVDMQRESGRWVVESESTRDPE